MCLFLSQSLDKHAYIKTEVYSLFGPRPAVYYFYWTRRPKTKLWSELLKVSKTASKINLARLFVVCSLILLPSELLQNVTSCKTLNSSMKFKFIHKIAVIHETFLVLSNLLQEPEIIRSGAGSGPWVVHPCIKTSSLKKNISSKTPSPSQLHWPH